MSAPRFSPRDKRVIFAASLRLLAQRVDCGIRVSRSDVVRLLGFCEPDDDHKGPAIHDDELCLAEARI